MTTLYIACHGLIFKGGEFLVIRRARSNDYKPLKWDLPGGTLSPGESIEECLIREIKEETGATVNISNILYAHTNFDGFPARQTFQLIYRCEYLGGAIALNPEEHDKYTWATSEAVRLLDTIEFLHSFIESKQSLVHMRIPANQIAAI
jgi:8-oxo-dGTP diphosphatase